MSGFGIRALKKVKDDEKAQDKRSYFKHIVYGENWASYLTFYHLNKKYPGEVRLITRDLYGLENIKKEWKSGLFSVRSQEVADSLTSLSSHFEIFSDKKDVLFYKDAKFHKFGGRAKPHDLREQETFFSKDFFNIKKDFLISNIDEASVKEFQLNRIVDKIEVVDPTDLVEVTNFKIHTGEYECFDCEYLYFGESPKSFFSMVKNKDQLPESIHKFCAGLENFSAIEVAFKVDKKIHENSGTVIIPQSLTHDWGSFVCDFDKYDEAENSQEFKTLTYISENEVQEEDLAKKLNL